MVGLLPNLRNAISGVGTLVLMRDGSSTVSHDIYIFLVEWLMCE